MLKGPTKRLLPPNSKPAAEPFAMTHCFSKKRTLRVLPMGTKMLVVTWYFISQYIIHMMDCKENEQTCSDEHDDIC